VAGLHVVGLPGERGSAKVQIRFLESQVKVELRPLRLEEFLGGGGQGSVKVQSRFWPRNPEMKT
jgi:hypothetical protein